MRTAGGGEAPGRPRTVATAPVHSPTRVSSHRAVRPRPAAPHAELIERYAQLLAANGRLKIALEYLSLIPCVLRCWRALAR